MKIKLYFEKVPFVRFGFFKREWLKCLGENDWLKGTIKGVWIWKYQVGIILKGY